MSKGVKLLITGLENSGKTTVTSQLEGAMIVVVDEKRYPFNVPHYKMGKYEGLVGFKNELIAKIKSYKAKFGKNPKTVVIDTVTKLYESMYLYANANYKGFDIHNSISTDTLAFNTLLENLLVANGINVVIAAHVVYDESTARYIVPATGQFKNTGSWLSVVDEASFLYVLGNERWIAHTEIKYPCRSTLDLKPAEPVKAYDINAHIKSLEAKSNDAEANEL